MFSDGQAGSFRARFFLEMSRDIAARCSYRITSRTLSARFGPKATPQSEMGAKVRGLKRRLGKTNFRRDSAPQKIEPHRRKSECYWPEAVCGGWLAKYWLSSEVSWFNPARTSRSSASTTSDTFFPLTGSSCV